MAEAVAAVIADGGTLLAEAGTGTGKTLAYLIPAILSRQRVLVSTGTKNLQEQIFFKDLPALQASAWRAVHGDADEGARQLPVPASVGDLPDGGGSSRQRTSDRTGDVCCCRSSRTGRRGRTTGDRAELRDLPEDLPLWKEISAEAETCLGTECPRYGDCWVTLMRQRAAESDVVIVNHHLLCADAAVRQSAYGEVIPSCPTLVVDEAHQLEDVATQYFGSCSATTASTTSCAMSNGSWRAERRCGCSATFAPREMEEATRALTRVAERSRVFFAGLSMARALAGGAGAESRARYSAEAMAEHFEDGMMLAGALEGLESTFALLKPKSSEPRRGCRCEGSDRSVAAPRAASCATTSGSSCVRPTRSSSTTSSRAAAGCSCAPRRSTYRASSATRCSIACARRFSRRPRSRWTAPSNT